MIPLTIPGRAPVAVQPTATRDRLSAFGEDLIAAFAIHLSPERLPGVAATGDVIGAIGPLAARRDGFGRFATATGGGATLELVDGRRAASTIVGVPSTDARPADGTSFGIGMLYNFTAGALAETLDHMGNNESGGGKSPHILRRAVGSSMDQLLSWKGIRSTWLPDQPADVKGRVTITEPGWYILAADEAGGNSALAVDRRDTVVAPTDALVPTLSRVFFGGSSLATPGLGAVAAFIVCDGPLVQNAARLEAWRAFAEAVRDEIAG